MRMWMVNVEYMCDAHLRQEHNDVHAIERRLKKNISTEDIECEPNAVFSRHKELVEEMLKRGFGHNTELKESKRKDSDQMVWVTQAQAYLFAKCKDCRRKVIDEHDMDTEKIRA